MKLDGKLKLKLHFVSSKTEGLSIISVSSSVCCISSLSSFFSFDLDMVLGTVFPKIAVVRNKKNLF